jgi:hypothetical protein
MVKIPGDPEPYQERQKEKRRERRRKRNLSHIDEGEMVRPAKDFLEGHLINPEEIVGWFEEPKVIIRSRKSNETASKVWENPDLICEADAGGTPVFYVIELKKVLGKKSVGQALMYKWAIDSGLNIGAGEDPIEIPDDAIVCSVICYLKPSQEYYRDFINWIGNMQELSGLFFAFQIPFER